MLSLIYARSENRVIGNAGRIPWRLPDEFKHFKRTTMGHPIIMGRKSYEDHESALPGRLNIVVTSNADYQAAEGVEVVSSLEQAFERAAEDNPDYFVIGGVSLFNAAMPDAAVVYETLVHAEIDGDTTLPAYDFSDDKWTTTVLEKHPVDDRHEYAFTMLRHDRICR